MAEYRYLKDKQYYIDQYDLHTIEECLDYYWHIKDGFAKDRLKFKDYTDKQFNTEVHKVASYTVNAIKGERYRHKKETIAKLIDRDSRMQELYDIVQYPKGITCIICHSPTKVISKDLYDAYEDTARMLFTFECVKCKKRQAHFENGQEWHYEPPRCPKCHAPLESKLKDKNEVLTTTYTCPRCEYKKKEAYDFKKSRQEREAKEKRDRKLLDEYRAEFCLDDTTGPEYILSMDRIIAFSKEMKATEEKEKDPVYQKAMKLKKLSVIELEKLLSPILEKNKYIRLSFDKPEIERYVVVPFTVQEADAKRDVRESVYDLKGLIRKALEGTNWRLTSEGASYRLGYIYGKLKGYEQEEDLIKIVK